MLRGSGVVEVDSRGDLILTDSTSIEQAEIDLTKALIQQLKRLKDHESTRWESVGFPRVRFVRLRLRRSLT